MKRILITISAVCALSFGAVAFLQAGVHAMGGPGDCFHEGNHFEEITQELNLSDEQKAKVQPILDQTKPQIQAIHEEAMQKMKSVMENTMAQVRPLLTAQQQQKLDAIKKAHEDMANAMRELHETKSK